jgi:hypothetical protein
LPWVPDILQKRDCIILAVKRRFLKRNHKFGICMPKLVELPAFKILDQNAPELVAHTWIPCHMIFDIKMDFTCKARFVAGGHVPDPPSSITYASVVTCNSVCIALLIMHLLFVCCVV